MLAVLAVPLVGYALQVRHFQRIAKKPSAKSSKQRRFAQNIENIDALTPNAHPVGCALVVG